MTLPISEIFYSLQGEGERTGTANVFIRIQGCKAKNACYALGIRCDTEFESGIETEVTALLQQVKDLAPTCKNIIWTGGEPADRITDEVAAFFKAEGYYQCIETSGLFPVAKGLDYVVVSPKVAEHVVKKNFDHISELRYVRHKGQGIPVPSITADTYYLSPHSDGFDINTENLKHCVQLCLDNPKWRMSVQDHKLWAVL
jgi:organic radical activating enzyme